MTFLIKMYHVHAASIIAEIVKRSGQIGPKSDENEIFNAEILHFRKCVNFLKHPINYSI